MSDATFTYTYNAREQQEIRKICEKYKPYAENPPEQMRKTDYAKQTRQPKSPAHKHLLLWE